MDFITLLLLAVGLSFDSFAVSVSCGVCVACHRSKMLRFAAVLGFWQALMPMAGWLLTAQFQHTIDRLDHWLAFGLLFFLGGKMIWNALFSKEQGIKGDPFSWGQNTLMGIATSIDALIAGMAMALLPPTLPEAPLWMNMLLAALMIGGVTVIASVTGLFIGRKSSGRLGERAELIGGGILILIGCRILLEHLCTH